MKHTKSADGWRRALIPLDHIVSELIAFPLASESAFINRVFALDPFMGGPTGKMWRDAERRIIQGVPDLSLDQVVAMRDRFWFHRDDDAHVGLSEYLTSIGRGVLKTMGPFAMHNFDSIRPYQGEDAEPIDISQSARSFRWLSYSLPPDLLAGVIGGERTPPAEIRYLTSQIRMRLKDHGFVETHLHIWAALEFPVLWIAALHALGDGMLRPEAFRSPGADFDEGRQLGPWLLRAAIARYFLAVFLQVSRLHFMETKATFSDGKKSTFSEFLGKRLLSEIGKQYGPAAQESIRTALAELAGGAFSEHSPDYALLRSLYRDMAVAPGLPFPANPDDVFSIDPVVQAMPLASRHGPSPEVFFTGRGIAYLENVPYEKDPLFAALFWQVLRIRCIYYRHLVQRPMTPGLQWFVRTYARIKPGRTTVGMQFAARAAARTCGMGKGLRALEVRTSPEGSSSENLVMVKDLLKGIASDVSHGSCAIDNDFEFGIIFHFAKIRRGGAMEGMAKAQWRKSAADPSHPGHFRYSKFYRGRKNDAMALARMLLDFPQTLKVVRGVDVCTDELGVPTWVLAPHLRYVRDAGMEVSRYFRCALGEEVPEIRTTVHTGEDFVHLLGGLRRVEEAVRYFKLQPGDRLGHAIALGIDPEGWAKRAGRVAMSREDRLFDLAWEWRQYNRRGTSRPSGRWGFVDREIKRLSELIFGKAHAPFLVDKFIQWLHDEPRLSWIGFPDRPKECFFGKGDNETRETKVWKLLTGYLTCPDIFARGQKIEWVNAVDEIETMKHLQFGLREAVAALGLVVEVNPSSNLLIGNLTDIEKHPMWRLDPPDGSLESPAIQVCIGSDDPITFATNLRREYEVLHKAMITGGLSDIQACAWLDRVRENGLLSRFTFLKASELGNPKNPDDPLEICSRYATGLGRYIEPMP